MKRILDSAYKSDLTPNHYLAGKLLVAMPFMTDNRFDHTVIYLCGHDEHGAIGLAINKPLNSLTFFDLLHQLDIRHLPTARPVQMLAGGSVEVSRGFVLHSEDYQSDSTVKSGNHYSITATLDILRSLAVGKGPRKFVLALGYVGWRAGQLEPVSYTHLTLPTKRIV